jgi:hypothetical protein
LGAEGHDLKEPWHEPGRAYMNKFKGEETEGMVEDERQGGEESKAPGG